MSLFSKKDKLEKPSHILLEVHYNCLNAIRSQKINNKHITEIMVYINAIKDKTDMANITPSTEMFILACEIRAFILLNYSFDIKNIKTVSEDMLSVYNYGKMIRERCNMHYLSCTADFLRMLIFIRTQVKDGFAKVFEEYMSFILSHIQEEDFDAVSSEMIFFQDIGSTFGRTMEARSELHDFIFSNSDCVTAQLTRNISMHYRLLNAEVSQMFQAGDKIN